MKVLVVDDNATNRRILEEMLQLQGMVPSMAESAEEALRLLNEAVENREPFPLVLTDVHMPEVDGFTLAEQIRQNAATRNVVIMVLTSGDRPGDRTRCADLGIAAYLMKPVKQSELFDSIMTTFGVAEPGAESADAPSTSADSVRPLEILLAEDVYANQMLAIGVLKKWNHTVTVASDGQEALEQLRTRAFDVVLMDVQMPEMDGFTATKVLRELEAKHILPHQKTVPRIPVIAMTAHAMKGDRERCLEAGMDGYVSKPVRPAELNAALSEFFSAAEVPGEPAPTDSRKSEAEVVLDWSHALESTMGDKDLLKQVVDSLLLDCPATLDNLQNAIRTQDATLMQRSAHTIAGIMRTFDATAISGIAEQLQNPGQDRDFESLQCLYDSLEKRVNVAMKELQAWSREYASEG